MDDSFGIFEDSKKGRIEGCMRDDPLGGLGEHGALFLGREKIKMVLILRGCIRGVRCRPAVSSGYVFVLWKFVTVA